MSRAGSERRKGALRILRALAGGPGRLRGGDGHGDSDTVELALATGRTLRVAPHHIRDLAAEALVGLRADGTVEATAEGLAWLRRALCAGSEERFQAQHQGRVSKVLKDDHGRSATVTVNLAESPLAWLARRRDRDGNTLIEPEQMLAGERLRADFERAGLSPRVTSNWEPSVRSAGRNAGRGLADLSDTAIDARGRVHRALEAVGPELSGVLLDVCCFLKGLEDTERDHGWPARTGKVVLKIALDRLARHYGLAGTTPRRRHGRLEHWGTDDFRPRAHGAAAPRPAGAEG